MTASGGTIPTGAAPAGFEANQTPIWVARAFFPDRAITPGKVSPVYGAAFIPSGGVEVAVNDYEVMMEQGNWSPTVSGGTVPEGAIALGFEPDGDPLFVARAQFNGGLHPGKLRFAFGGAIISWGGIEHLVSDYQVLLDN
jgi:hypothetical protein